MSRGERRYCRLYHDNATEMTDVFMDGPLYGAYCQLLRPADLAWPEPADLPRHVDEAQYERLLELGVVEAGPLPFTYRMPRLDADREEYSERGRQNVSHRADRTAVEQPYNSASTTRRNGTERDGTRASEPAPSGGASRSQGDKAKGGARHNGHTASEGEATNGHTPDWTRPDLLSDDELRQGLRVLDEGDRRRVGVRIEAQARKVV